MVSGGDGEVTASLLRDRGSGDHRVTPMELFFDLVYVLAITQLSHHLLEHLTVAGALQTLLLMVAVWRAWIDAAWITNWFDPNQRVVRLVLVAMMLTSLFMSASLSEAFGDRGWLFAVAAVTMQVGRGLFAVLALRGEPGLRRNFERILTWSTGAGSLWLIGGFLEGTGREIAWIAAVAVDIIGPAVGFVTPWLGKSHTSDWTISVGHLAERCQLFIILSLGESILVTGATFQGLELSVEMVAAFVVAFLGSVALWWIYFDRSVDAVNEVIERSTDPGRLGRSAYTYYHLPMVAGIIVTAVGDELIIAHPSELEGWATTAVVLGGPALFLLGHTLFKWSVFGKVSPSRVSAIVALGVLVPVSLVVSPLVLAGLVVLVLAGVGVWDGWSARHGLQPVVQE